MGNCGRFVKELRIPTGRRQTSWLFTSVLEDLNAGLPRTNPVSGQSHHVIDSTVAQSTLALRTLRYNGLSLMRTLPRGPYSVRYKGS